jgi:hypothetical protein
MGPTEGASLSVHHQSQSHLTTGRSVGQSVVVSGHHLGSGSKFSLTVIIFRHSSPSLMRGWVCNLLVQVLPSLASAVTLMSNDRRNWPYLTISFEPGFPFCRLLRLVRQRSRYSIPPPHGCDNNATSQSELSNHRRSVAAIKFSFSSVEIIVRLLRFFFFFFLAWSALSD